MTFGSPLLLAFLLVPVVVLAGYVWVQRRPPRYVVTYPNVSVLAQVAGRRRPWRRHLIAALLLVSLASLCVGLARPRLTVSAASERATIVLVIDVSVSMNATDVQPTRFGAAREAISRFVNDVPRPIRVALVAFSDDAVVITPPTVDRAQLQEGIAVLTPGFGTAIGDAIARGVEVARAATGEVAGDEVEGDAPVASAIVLLSDGAQTRGVLSPEDGAQLARRAGMPVHTIALGTLDGIVTVNRDGEEFTVPVPPDRETLAQIAETTGGQTFEVTDAKRLRTVYASLGSSLGRLREVREVTVAFVGFGAALLAAATGLAGLWSPRLP